MSSTYSTNLAIELMGAGEQAGNWGSTTNTNLGTLIEQAISGVVTQAMADADQTITIPNGATGVARNMFIECTGALTAARNLIVPTNKKLYFISNATTGGFAITVKVSGQTGVSVPAAAKIVLVMNSAGTDIVTATNYMASATLPSATLSSPTMTGTPIAPTASPGTNTTQVATTAFVTAATGTLGTMSTQNANNVAITGGTVSGLSSLSVSGTATATTFSGAGTSLTGTASSLNIGGNAATATSATSATTATTATNATNILGNSSQTYQNVTGSRAFGTTYTNSTGKPITVWFSSDAAIAGAITQGFVNGALACYTNMDLYPRAFAGFVVPISATYSITNNNGGISLNYWLELR
jgi:hypothetical protein